MVFELQALAQLRRLRRVLLVSSAYEGPIGEDYVFPRNGFYYWKDVRYLFLGYSNSRSVKADSQLVEQFVYGIRYGQKTDAQSSGVGCPGASVAGAGGS